MNDVLTKNLRPLSDYLPTVKDILKSRGNRPEMPLTTMPGLDSKLWGIKRRKLTIIAARPSIGKSSFTLQIAYDLASQGKNVLFLSLEMTVEDMLERLFVHKYKIDNQELMRGRFTSYVDKFESFSRHVETLSLCLVDGIGKNWQEVDETLKSFEVKPDVVFIDHINAIKSTGKNAKADIDEYILNIYTIAKRDNVAMILCCQINRDNQKDDDKTPQLHELKGSGNLEEMADIVILLHWPFKYKKETELMNRTKYHVIVAKNRNGPTGYVDICFKPEFYLFSDIQETPVITDKHWEE